MTTPDLQALIELSENELAAMECYGIVKDMRGDFASDDPEELAEFAQMCLNTVIHLGGLVERFRHPAPTLPGAGGDALDAARYRWLRREIANKAAVADVPADVLIAGEWMADGDDLDAAIDAALPQQGG